MKIRAISMQDRLLSASITSLHEVIDFSLTNASQLKEIDIIHISVEALQSKTDMANCLNTIRCSSAEPQAFRFVVENEGAHEEASWFSISPILPDLWSTLKRLEVEHPRTLPITDDDIFILLSTCQHLEDLVLNHSPARPLDVIPSLTMQALVYAAQMGPCLRTAGFYLDINTTPLSERSIYSWSSLLTLYLGVATTGQQTVELDDLRDGAYIINRLFPRARLITSNRELKGVLTLVREEATASA